MALRMTITVKLRFVNKAILAASARIPKFSRIAPKRAQLLLAEGLVAFRRQTMEQQLLVFDRQHGDPVFLSVTAGVEEPLYGLPPAQSGIGHQRLYILDDPGLLQIKALYDQILFCGKKE